MKTEAGENSIAKTKERWINEQRERKLKGEEAKEKIKDGNNNKAKKLVSLRFHK